MKRKLRDHHKVWLKAHPHRSETWLIAKLREGFDVHHVDGNSSNNCPLNLVMIEHTDHLSLHNGAFYTLGRLKKAGPKEWSQWETYTGGRHSIPKPAEIRRKGAKRQIRIEGGQPIDVPKGVMIDYFIRVCCEDVPYIGRSDTAPIG